MVVIQRTGSGKSLVYQVPALFSSTQYAIVICPTISLILNQVNQLKEKGIDAIPFGNPAGKDKRNNFVRLDEPEGVKPSLVYITPECFETKDEIKRIVMDEAHKIFDRDIAFRKSYESLQQIRLKFPETPVIALTASIDSVALDKLCTEYLREPVVIKGNVDRPNVKLSLGKYKLATGKTASESGNKQSTRPWKSVAQEV